MTADEIIKLLQLQPHPVEGGFFRETWRSADTLPQAALPHHPGPRSTGTAIYYLLTPHTYSAMHKLPTDEIFHFYFGDPVRMLQLFPGRPFDNAGAWQRPESGPDAASGRAGRRLAGQPPHRGRPLRLARRHHGPRLRLR